MNEKIDFILSYSKEYYKNELLKMDDSEIEKIFESICLYLEQDGEEWHVLNL